MPQINNSNFIVFRKEESTFIEKEHEAVGFSYQYLFGKQMSSLSFEAALLDVASYSKRKKVTTDAYEFKYVLSEECYYLIGEEEVLLKQGNNLNGLAAYSSFFGNTFFIIN
ncbi:hypothetical protein [Flavivirga spongiicola]|uniref:Uncharacterized protein n=1 Tax=Flavivirga spongiicola TaxID=421621 RepID=A0ABU7XU28_9FLAO|nr:hypothetical protein [Flavivirga sp. MEBiC05379]MDO5979022.1 hypothetical protein [Flavivirga sp. MEBiC05379]